MNLELTQRIRQVVFDYVERETTFANRMITSIEDISDSDEWHGKCFRVKMALSHSPEEIERILCEGDSQEAEIKREFLKGDFTLILILKDDTVVSTEWENFDID